MAPVRRYTTVNQAIAHNIIQATQLDLDEAWYHRFLCFVHFTYSEGAISVIQRDWMVQHRVPARRALINLQDTVLDGVLMNTLFELFVPIPCAKVCNAQ